MTKLPIFIIILMCLFIGFNCKSNISNSSSVQSQDEKDEELIEAVADENAEKVNKLLEKGANPNSFSKSPETATLNNTALGIAIDKKNVEIARLLLEKGANVDKKYIDGDTLNFREAVYHQDVQMAKLLVEFKANTDINNTVSPTILDAETAEMLDFLVAQGFDINAHESEGRTCLINAVFAQDLALVKAVLRHKPNNLAAKTQPLPVTDSQQMTALQLAKAYGNKEIVDELKKAGAK